VPEEQDNMPTPEAEEEVVAPPAVAPEELDAAHESLATALRVCFVILKVIIFFMVVGYVLSGFYIVQQDQVAIALRFGKVTRGAEGTVRGPGMHLNWPPPIGEIVRISTRVREIEVNTFWPQVSEREREEAAGDVKRGDEEFRKREVDRAYEGAENAYFMSGDLIEVREAAKGEVRKDAAPNLLQARFIVRYTVSKGSALDYFHNVKDEATEKALVKQCLEAAVVRAAAGYGVFDMLKDKPGAFRADVRAALGEALDQVRSGIDVQEINMAGPIAPKSVAGAFQDVLAAEMERSSLPQAARADMTSKLRGVAGEVGEDLGKAILELWDLEDKFAAEDYQQLDVEESGATRADAETVQRTPEKEREAALAKQRAKIDELYAKASGEVEELIQQAETTRRRTRERARGLSERLAQLKATYKGQQEFLENERLKAVAKLLRYAEEKYFIVEKASGERVIRIDISRHPDAVKREVKQTR